MSMPKDFSEDGAAGASGPPHGTAGTFGNSSSGGAIPSNWLANGALAPNGFGGVFQGNQISDAQAENEFGAGAMSQGALGLMFEDGGVVPDQDDASSGATPDGGDPTSGTGDPISLALTTVDNALAYGRKLNGLPTDGGAGGQQMAQNGYQNGRMPAVPGNASEGGFKPIQPMPGPLPPTSNPFGKRTAENEQGDGDDSAPTIPTDDDEEETA